MTGGSPGGSISKHSFTDSKASPGMVGTTVSYMAPPGLSSLSGVPDSAAGSYMRPVMTAAEMSRLNRGYGPAGPRAGPYANKSRPNSLRTVTAASPHSPTANGSRSPSSKGLPTSAGSAASGHSSRLVASRSSGALVSQSSARSSLNGRL